MHGRLAAIAALLMLSGTAGCSAPQPLSVEPGELRLNANPAAPSAAYFTILGGAQPVELRGIATGDAARVELHESATEGGVASMRKIEKLEVPADGSIRMAPGGLHVMVWSLDPQAVAKGRLTFQFTFSNGARIVADAAIRQPGAASEGDSGHQGH